MTTPINRCWVFWGLALVAVSLDLGTKAWVESALLPGHGRTFLSGIVRIYHLPEVNRGAFFSLGSRWGPNANLVFASISFLVILVILLIHLRPTIRQSAYLSAALGCIFGGALGNLHDRIRYGGVRDFLQLFLPLGQDSHVPLTAVFNLADTALLLGAAMLLLASWREPCPKGEAAAR
ncbi:MAG: signal peptidase II [Gemmatales bacterium]|nr:signal peptidase II [Gemmatales bacterium]MDW8223006.1 signal peptidase II [Gemmatales bacterium]